VDQPRLPPQIRVIVRDWLSANNILLRGRNATVLIDTGYVSRASETLSLLRRPQHLGSDPLNWLVNTHCHSDHMGGNAAIQRVYACRTSVPEGEAQLIREWDTRGLWLDYAGQHAERFGFDDVIAPGQTYRWGDLEWLAIAAPGHDAGALMFYCAEERALITGDALWENGFGIVLPDVPKGLEEARRTLDAIAALDVRVVIPGHGLPFTEVAAALERSFARVDALRGNPERIARNVLKVMLVFSLLDRESLALATLPHYLASVPIYREYNERYFKLTAAQLTERLIDELEKSGAAHRAGGLLLAGNS
jgi:glyoxylase-like metal-dependent hydrolase (beta-lactamase superfamily II)